MVQNLFHSCSEVEELNGFRSSFCSGPTTQDKFQADPGYRSKFSFLSNLKVAGHGKHFQALDNLAREINELAGRTAPLNYSQRALKILEKWYGPDNPTTKQVAENLDSIKRAKQR